MTPKTENDIRERTTTGKFYQKHGFLKFLNKIWQTKIDTRILKVFSFITLSRAQKNWVAFPYHFKGVKDLIRLFSIQLFPLGWKLLQGSYSPGLRLKAEQKYFIFSDVHTFLEMLPWPLYQDLAQRFHRSYQHFTALA